MDCTKATQTCQEVLTDRFQWKEAKAKTMRLYELYEAAGYHDYAVRTRDCATYLQFGITSGGARKLRTANFCKLRLCPMCISRRARRNAWQLSRVLDLTEQRHDARYLFLTLTIRNVDGEHLSDALQELTNAWRRFVKQRQIERSVKGWFRAIEITRRGKGYHPHIHAILAVEPDYFSRESRQSGKYLNQTELIDRWKDALRAAYRPSVRIQTTKAKGEYTGKAKAAAEAGKYAVKDEEYIDPKIPESRAVEILTDYTRALHRRRLTAFGGWLKDAARELEADDLDDGDLIHTDAESIRDDVIELVETYSWRFGAGDYVLAARELSPLVTVTEDGEIVPQTT